MSQFGTCVIWEAFSLFLTNESGQFKRVKGIRKDALPLDLIYTCKRIYNQGRELFSYV